MTGTLGLFSLVDLFQLLSGASRSGRLVVDHPAGPAKIYFAKGDAIHAEFAGLEGEDAVFALFADERGSFDFRIGLQAPRTTISLGTQNLVLEGARRLDESRRGDDGRQAEPDVVPERVPDDARPRLALGPDERALLEHVDGRRSLGRIADLTGREFDATARVAERLAAAGALRLERRRPRTARLVVRASKEALPPGVAALDPAIVDAWTRAMGVTPREVVCKRESGRVERLRIRPHEGAGPYMLFGRDVLLRTGLVADEPLLVRPAEADA